jgi:hypothetical protein
VKEVIPKKIVSRNDSKQRPSVSLESISVKQELLAVSWADLMVEHACYMYYFFCALSFRKLLEQ